MSLKFLFKTLINSSITFFKANENYCLHSELLNYLPFLKARIGAVFVKFWVVKFCLVDTDVER